MRRLEAPISTLVSANEQVQHITELERYKYNIESLSVARNTSLSIQHI